MAQSTNCDQLLSAWDVKLSAAQNVLFDEFGLTMDAVLEIEDSGWAEGSDRDFVDTRVYSVLLASRRGELDLIGIEDWDVALNAATTYDIEAESVD